MRNKFDMQLDILNNELITMGALCERGIATAVKALLNNDKVLALSVEAIEEQINQKEQHIESLCLKLLLSQQPVAKDLRLISASLKMITDMERIGDQALDISEIVATCDLFAVNTQENISAMAFAAISMVTGSIDAFVKKDLVLAEKVINDDDIVDNFFIKIKNDLINLIAEDTKNGTLAMDLLMVVKYLERIGDHATNIAEWVIFSITGEHKEG